MRIEVRHPAFKRQHLSVQTASSVFSSPKLLLNGAAVKKEKGRYPVTSDSGAMKLVQMRYNLVDPVPTLKIDEQTVNLLEPLQWYEYAWSGLPILLVFAGGALGGLVGGAATIANGRIFRSERSSIAKYGLAGLITVSAAVVFFVLAIGLRSGVGSLMRYIAAWA
jgi:hypothetical protein